MASAPGFRLSRAASADLRRIYREGKRQWGTAQAEQYARQFWQCFGMLALHRHAGRPRPELRPSGLRSFAQGSHVVFYQPQPSGVLIIRILGSRQDVTRRLGPDAPPDSEG